MQQDNMPLDSIEDYPEGAEDDIGWVTDLGDQAFLITHRTECQMRDRQIILWGCVEFTATHYWPEYDGGDDWVAHAYLVTDPSQMHEDALSEIYTDQVTVYDVCDYGLRIPLGEYSGSTLEECYLGVLEILRASTLSGFVLDKRWNAIGTNGWDVIAECVFGEDMFERSRKRTTELK